MNIFQKVFKKVTPTVDLERAVGGGAVQLRHAQWQMAAETRVRRPAVRLDARVRRQRREEHVREGSIWEKTVKFLKKKTPTIHSRLERGQHGLGDGHALEVGADWLALVDQ